MERNDYIPIQYPQALDTILGVIAAREHDRVEDASTLISSFVADVMASGKSEAAAYRQLFSQAVVFAHGQLSDVAEDEGKSFDELLAEVNYAALAVPRCGE